MDVGALWLVVGLFAGWWARWLLYRKLDLAKDRAKDDLIVTLREGSDWYRESLEWHRSHLASIRAAPVPKAPAAAPPEPYEVVPRHIPFSWPPQI